MPALKTFCQWRNWAATSRLFNGPASLASYWGRPPLNFALPKAGESVSVDASSGVSTLTDDIRCDGNRLDV
jgi:hypothetical protein